MVVETLSCRGDDASDDSLSQACLDVLRAFLPLHPAQATTRHTKGNTTST
ncbi:hypothetical protein [Streptomyces hydrogenans]